MGAGIFIQPPAFRKEGGRLAFGAAILAALLALGVPPSLAQAPVPSPPAPLPEGEGTGNPLPPGEGGAERRVGETPSPEAVPEVRVEAERAPARAPVRDQTAAASVITREQIEQAAQDIPGLLDREVGVQVREVGGFGSYSSISIRGSSPDQVRVFLDGVPLDRGTGSAVDISAVPAENLERIEIYRGVAPLSVGGSAIGGVVDLRSRRPQKSSLEVLAGGGSFGLRRGGLYAARVEEGEPWAAAAALLYEAAENDYSFTFDNGTPVNPADDYARGLENADYDKGDVLLQALRDMAGSGRLSLSAVFHVRETGLSAGAAVGPNQNRLLETFSTASAALSLPDFTSKTAVEGRAYFSILRTRYGPHADATDDRDYLAGAQLDASHYLTDFLKIEGFGEYRFEIFDPEGNLGASTPVGPASRRHFFTLASGAEYEILPDRLLALAQIRYEDARDRLRPSSAGATSAPGAIHQALTGRGGLRWRPGAGFTFSANFSRAVRLPQFTELFGNTGLIRGDADIREEKGLLLDAGGEWECAALPWAGRLQLGARYFFSDVKDLITFEASSPGHLRVANLPGARTHGVEATALWEAPRLLVWSSNLTWLRARQKDYPSFAVQFSPDRQFYSRATVQESFPGAVSKAGVWSDFEYISGNFLGQANVGGVPPRTLLGAGAFADFWKGRLSLTVEGRNLLDRRDLYNFADLPLPGLSFLGTLRWRPV